VLVKGVGSDLESRRVMTGGSFASDINSGQGGQSQAQAIPRRILTRTSVVDQSIWVLQPAVPFPEDPYSHVQVVGLVLTRSGLTESDTSGVYCYEIATQKENVS
jgi:hypothetical protein